MQPSKRSKPVVVYGLLELKHPSEYQVIVDRFNNMTVSSVEIIDHDYHPSCPNDPMTIFVRFRTNASRAANPHSKNREVPDIKDKLDKMLNRNVDVSMLRSRWDPRDDTDAGHIPWGASA